MAKKITLDDLAVMDQKEQQKMRLLFQFAAQDHYINKFCKENPGVRKGEKLSVEQAQTLAEQQAKVFIEAYMKDYLGIADPKIEEGKLQEIGEAVLGVSVPQLAQQFKNRVVTPDMLAEIGASTADQLLQLKQQGLSRRLTLHLTEEDGDAFRKDFGDYFVKKTGDKMLDAERLKRMDANLFLSTYRVLSAQNDALETLHGNYIKPYNKPKQP